MEKSQDQIIYENTCLQLVLGEYRNHPPKSLGNIIHYLRGYGLLQYDTVQIGYSNNIGSVTLWGKTIATYTFNEDEQPVFIFDEEHKYQQNHQDNYLKFKNVFENPFLKWQS